MVGVAKVDNPSYIEALYDSRTQRDSKYRKESHRHERVFSVARGNAELVFTPWEGREFGVAVTLPHAGRYQWRESNNVFIEHISWAEQTGNSSTFYQRRLAALGQLALQ